MENQILQPNTNTGVRITHPADIVKLFEVGDVPTIIAPLDWRPFIGSPRNQKFGNWDTQACMTFSALDTFKTYANWLLSTNQISPEKVALLQANGFIITNAGNFSLPLEISLSDRFLAKMDGTTQQGNDFDNVWNALAQYGCVPEADWTYTNEQALSFKAYQDFWNDYYQTIPEVLIAKAKIFLSVFSVHFQFIVIQGTTVNPLSSVQNSLSKTPVQVAIPVCPPWNTADVLEPCGSSQPQHGVEIVAVDTAIHFQDQYAPFLKQFDLKYDIPYAVVPVIQLVPNPAAPTNFTHVFTQTLVYGQTSAEINALQQALAFLGFFHMTPTGFYGENTRLAVFAWQTANGVASSLVLNQLQGRSFGPLSIARMNTELNG